MARAWAGSPGGAAGPAQVAFSAPGPNSGDGLSLSLGVGEGGPLTETYSLQCGGDSGNSSRPRCSPRGFSLKRSLCRCAIRGLPWARRPHLTRRRPWFHAPISTHLLPAQCAFRSFGSCHSLTKSKDKVPPTRRQPGPRRHLSPRLLVAESSGGRILPAGRPFFRLNTHKRV